MPPEVLQRIACDAQLTGLIFSNGKPLRHGPTVRTATTKQWRALIARDGGCIGCGAEPSRCQAHHIVPYARLRRTDIENLVLVCWRCHHNIHDHHWHPKPGPQDDATAKRGHPRQEPDGRAGPCHPQRLLVESAVWAGLGQGRPQGRRAAGDPDWFKTSDL